MRIAHIADTHIRNFKYHKEYRNIFEQIYSSLRQQQVDLIVHCGDLAHTKTQLSPEYFEMAASFLESLANIAPTYIILGNHDGNLKNERRQDAITPIVKALQHPDLHLLKDACEVDVERSNVTLNVLSVFDEENWVPPTRAERINIALYHGAIAGVKTDTGWTMEHGDHPVDIFKNFDYAFLGDIHKTNQTLDPEGRVRYPGSTVQQGFGETNDKGFLLWDIQSKDDFTCEHIAMPNPKPFVTVDLTPTGNLPSGLDVPRGCRLRLVSNNNLPVETIRKAKGAAQHRFKPDTITFLNRGVGSRNGAEQLDDVIEQDNMRDLAVQETLIREFLSDYEVEESLMKKVLELNSEYTKRAEETEEISRNIKWNLEELRWENLFNYGEGNSIDFTKLNGIVGIFGKNFTGKSSIIDSLLYTLFNTTSKNEKKNVNIINQNRSEGTGEVLISIGEEQYYISRRSIKQVKRVKGKEVASSKTELDFYKIDSEGERVCLNGMTRNDTDKNIRKVFGSIEDFLLTSLASQMDSLSFIREGSTKRKEILAKFLDLEIFDKKHKLAKDDVSDLRGALRRAGEKDYASDIEEATLNVTELEKSLAIEQTKTGSLESEAEALAQEVATLYQKIQQTPTELIDIGAVRKKLRALRTQLYDSKKNMKDSQDKIKSNTVLIGKMGLFLENFNIEELTGLERQLGILVRQIQFAEEQLEAVSKKKQLLSKVPCGKTYPSCMFIKDAISSADKESEILNNLKILRRDRDSITEQAVSDHILKYNTVSEKRGLTERENQRLLLLVEQERNNISILEQDIEKLSNKVVEYERNKEMVEQLGEMHKQHDSRKEELSELHSEIEGCKRRIGTLQRNSGSAEQKLQTLKQQRDELENLNKEYAAYDLYLRCMHPNGIAYDVIKKKLPIINQEISKVLSNLAIFEVFFEEDGNKLDIFIQHPEHDPRPLSMASGAEKTMAAMAIRLAFLSVSNLPTGDIMVLDEPGTALDEEHLQSFTQLLDMLKEYFKTTLLISHLDSLKDVVDSALDISQREGFAFINQ